MKIINLISGPRNLSTALMYSFAQRNDTTVLDEPFYAHYLSSPQVAVAHPSEKEILASMDKNQANVITHINSLSEKTNVFVKGMAHHYLTDDPEFILKWHNVILIRHPEKLLTSFSKVIENPTIADIGIKKAAQLFLFLKENNKTPLVIDSDELLINAEKYLQKVCENLDIPFLESMLSWKKGGVKEDGVWASHWYENVHNSEGFSVQNKSGQDMPKRLQPVLDEALVYYNTLRNHILKND